MAYLASPAGDYYSGSVLTIDGARDNWFGPWPPAGLVDEGGKPLAEERRGSEARNESTATGQSTESFAVVPVDYRVDCRPTWSFR